MEHSRQLQPGVVLPAVQSCKGCITLPPQANDSLVLVFRGGTSRRTSLSGRFRSSGSPRFWCVVTLPTSPCGVIPHYSIRTMSSQATAVITHSQTMVLSAGCGCFSEILQLEVEKFPELSGSSAKSSCCCGCGISLHWRANQDNQARFAGSRRVLTLSSHSATQGSVEKKSTLQNKMKLLFGGK